MKTEPSIRSEWHGSSLESHIERSIIIYEKTKLESAGLVAQDRQKKRGEFQNESGRL